MKPLRSLLSAGLALAVLITPARAITFPAFADTAGAPPPGLLSKSAGKATTLTVSAKSTAYVSFNASGSGLITDPFAVTAARLIVYFPKVSKPGTITVTANGAAFSETSPGTSPTPSQVLSGLAPAPFQVGPGLAKNFFILDVTGIVQIWLLNPGLEQGFAIAGDALVSATIGAKEGSGSGYPVVLEVDASSTTGTLTGTNAAFVGNVGIGSGTVPTQAKLAVTGNVSNAFTSGAFLDGTGANTISSNRNFLVSIFSSHAVWTGGAFVSSSDARIKNIQGRSDRAADLRTLSNIEITDYFYKDQLTHGGTPQKKIIAQQVEKVFPQAVSQHTEVIPDIYQQAVIKDGWVNLTTDVKVGERVKLITAANEEVVQEVLEVREGGFRTAFQPAGERVFVYGREVKDFRTVDYEAISMLNVSATQELARKLETKDAEIATLKAANLALAAKMAAFDEKLTALKASLDDRPARTVRAALDLK